MFVYQRVSLLFLKCWHPLLQSFSWSKDCATLSEITLCLGATQLSDTENQHVMAVAQAALLPLALAFQGPVFFGKSIEPESGQFRMSMIFPDALSNPKVPASKSSPATEHIFPDGSTVEHT